MMKARGGGGRFESPSIYWMSIDSVFLRQGSSSPKDETHKKNSHVSRTDGKMYIICIATALALGVDL